MDLDLNNITLVGLAVIGAVNAATIFKPDLDSRAKFVLSVLVALVVGLIPPDIGAEVFNRLKEALLAAFAFSGVYKLSQKLGGQ